MGLDSPVAFEREVNSLLPSEVGVLFSSEDLISQISCCRVAIIIIIGA